MVKFTRVKSAAAPGPMRSTGKLTARMRQYEDYVNAVKSSEVGPADPRRGGDRPAVWRSAFRALPSE